MYSMNYIGKFISNFRDFYNEINAATLTGAIDVVVVEQADGSFTCSPFHVRFGKLGVLRSREKVVDIEINGEARQIHMKLGDSGEAFFVEEVSLDGSPTDSEIPPHLACSPIPDPDDTCFPRDRFRIGDLGPEQQEIILRDSVLSIEREKLEETAQLPPDERERFLLRQLPNLPKEQREQWLRIASLTYEERDKIFRESFNDASTLEKQRLIREQYSALGPEDRERLFKENFPELPPEQRKNFEKALLVDWEEKPKVVDWDARKPSNEEEIFDMDGIDEDEPRAVISTPKSFVAVTSSDRIRKISVVNNDFRPIIDESNATLANSNSKEENVDETKNTGSSKKKRKRKSVMKRKGSQRRTSNGSSSQMEMSESDTVATEDNHNDCAQKAPSPVIEAESKTIASEALATTTNYPPATDFHFFSDTEVTKNQNSRPSSPIQSDTEFEMQKIVEQGDERNADKQHPQSWRWGELPSPPPDTKHPLNANATMVPSNDTEAHRPMLSGMFSFMKKTSRVRHNPESEGIYLSDLNADELDPEVAALYFPSSHRGPTVVKECKDEEDTESGNGPSLPQSPNSVEGAIGGPKSSDSDFDESKQSSFENNLEISLSLCGGLDTVGGPSDESFVQNQLRFEDVCSDVKLYENPNLVVKINGKFYNWATACPIIVTLAAFQRGLPQPAVENLYAQYISLPVHQANEKPMSTGSKSAEGRTGYSSWFSWRRAAQPIKQNVPQVETAAAISTENAPPEHSVINVEEIVGESNAPELEPKVEEAVETAVEAELTGIEIKPVKSGEGEGYSGGEDSDGNQNGKSASVKIPKERRAYYENQTEKYRKTLRLSSEQIASLNLKEGANEVMFSVTTAYQGTSRCKCHIYKWRWDDKIVISDIDGTITKSDVLGHILPIVGKDWAQSGVAQLFTKIKNNGYKLLYLSARAIGQARVTREYLKSIKQGDLSLPEGPLLLNPTSLISAFHREVIEKKPERFKISCLSDIQALFPEGSKPFYAGYGNRINDVWAYRAVGIPIMRIFTINHRGELKHELTQTFQSSYSNMSFIVDHLFPPLREDAADEFSNFAYWRDPIAELPALEAIVVDSQAAPPVPAVATVSTAATVATAQ